MSIFRDVDLGGSPKIDALDIDCRDLPAILELDDPIVSLIAADRFVRINRLRDFKLWRLAAFNQIEHERGRPDFHRRRPFTHVRVAQDNVEASITAGIDMRFVAGIDERPPVHRVDADDDAKKIRALRNLIYTGLTRRALGFDAHFSGSGKNLACDQKRQDSGHELVPRHIAAHQVIVVATVAVPDKVGVVFVKTNLAPGWKFRVSTPRALGQDAFAGLVLRDNLPEHAAFRRGIFRMRMIVVKTRAV